MASYYDSELLAAAAGLGSLKKNKRTGDEVYEKGHNCLESIQALQRMLRKENAEIRDVFKALGTWNTVKKDLIPILMTYQNEPKIIFATCKLLVSITMPPQAQSSNLAHQWEFLQTYKEAFMGNFMGKDILSIIMTLLADPMSKSSGERTEEESQLIELILTLFRNLLSIPDPMPTKAVADTRANMHDALILAYQRANILELLIVVGSNDQTVVEKHWDILLLEIFYLILRKETPAGLLDAYVNSQAYASDNKENSRENTNGQSNGHPNKAGGSKLSQLMAKEKQSAKVRASASPSRHSKSSGVFMSTQITGGQKVINNPTDLTSPQPTGKSIKVRGATGTAKAPLPEEHYVSSSNELKVALKSFVDQVLLDCYNTLMRSVKQELERGDSKRLIGSDLSNYLWLVRFFSGYHYLSQNLEIAKHTQADEPIDYALIASTMDLSSFKFIIQKCELALEGKAWAKLDLAVGAITEMVNVLHLMTEKGGRMTRHKALNMQSNIFYDRTLFLDKVFHFVRTFDAGKHPKSLLVELVQLVHITLSMLEGTHVYVAKRPKKTKEKTVPKDGETGATESNGSNESAAKKDPAVAVDADANAEPAEKPADADDDEKDNEDKEKEAAVEAEAIVQETRLNFQSYLNSFAHNAVISNYTYLLKDFKDNRPTTNHQLISLFNRIVTQCELTPMFYQLSIFIVFDKLLSDPCLQKEAQYKEIYTFVSSIVDSFFLAASTNKFLFATVLFWKTRLDCHMLSNGGLDDDEDDFIEREEPQRTEKHKGPSRFKMAEWSQEEDQTLKSYFNTNKDSSAAIDLVVATMGGQRTAAEVYKRLDQLGVLTAKHKRTFGDIAREAELIDTSDQEQDQPQTTHTPHANNKSSLCQQLASSRGRGPKALAWLKEKIEEAAMLRDNSGIYLHPINNSK